MKKILGLIAAILLAASPLMAQTISGGGGSSGGSSTFSSNNNIVQVGSQPIALGQGTMASSMPVAIANNQTVPVLVSTALPAGTAVIGKVSIDQTTPGTTNLVAGNITQVAGNPLAIGQSLMASAFPVVLASDQTPLVPQKYTGSVITRPATSPTYAQGQLLYSTATSSTADTATIQVSRSASTNSTLYNMDLTFSSNVSTNAVFRVHLYNSQPTLTSGDAGVWSTASTGYQGCFDVTMTQTFNNGMSGHGVPCAGSVLVVSPVTGQNYDYYAIEVRAAYVGVSASTVTPVVEVP